VSTEKIYNRQPVETDLSWRAFSDYLVMEKPRTLVSLHATYTQSTYKQKSPTQSHRTLQGWYRLYDWKERAAAYDLDHAQIAMAAIAEEEQSRLIADWRDFKSTVRNSGRTGVIVSNNCKTAINSLMQGKTADQLDMKTLQKMSELARVVQRIESSSHELWAKAIAIDKLLMRLEDGNG
jgi:hypothetical protein